MYNNKITELYGTKQNYEIHPHDLPTSQRTASSFPVPKYLFETGQGTSGIAAHPI